MALHCIKKDKSKQKILLVREKKRYALKRGADQGEIGKGKKKKKRIKPERERERYEDCYLWIRNEALPGRDLVIMDEWL